MLSPQLTNSPPPPLTTLVDLLRDRTSRQADQIAFTFLRDGEIEQDQWSYRLLDQRARALAAHLQSLPNCRGERALLLYPPGLEFVAAFFGCLYANVIAVPVYPPRRNHHLHRLQAILEDADATIALTTTDVSARIAPWLADVPAMQSIHWCATDQLDLQQATTWREPALASETIAFLQYTSGSTGHPKGVMVSHANLLHSTADQDYTWMHSPEGAIVTWLPVFHDLGLIYGMLQPIYSAIPCYMMAPVAFLQQPVRWLQAISRYRATHSAAPNFAYDLCVQKISAEQRAVLDLSSWQMAMNGAEPVRPATLTKFSDTFQDCGFNPQAHCPAYGLAEATLKVTTIAKGDEPVLLTVDALALARDRVVLSAPDQPHSLTIASCGQAVLNTQVVIVHPEQCTRCAPDQVGEIWVAGPLVAQGYWRNPEATQATFQSHFANGDQRDFLRTGDLGFLYNNALFVTGRLKDLIIIDGMNYYPQDIEQTVETCHPALRPGASAAFAIEVNGKECLAIAQELERRYLRDHNLEPVVVAIRQAIAVHHDLPVHTVLLLKTGSVPKTSSGKIQRRACRQAWQSGTLAVVYDWSCDPRQKLSFSRLSSDIQSMTEQLLQQLQRDAQTKGGGTIELTPTPGSASVASPVPSNLSQQSVRSATEIQSWLKHRLGDRLAIAPDVIDPAQPLAYYGLTSREAVSLLVELEAWSGQPCSPTLIWDYPTIRALSDYLAGDHSAQPCPDAALSPPAPSQEPIAIVGMGCRFPGAANLEQFWHLLQAGQDAITPVPRDRWEASEFNPETITGMHWGGFLADLDQFDPQFFGISGREASRIDPQQRLLMEVTWEALEHAGERPDQLAGSATGVFMGLASQDYSWLQLSDLDAIDAYAGTGNAHSIAANRLSYWLDWRGPSIAVDTACSASLVAVHLAVQSLQSGDCHLAIAGGVNAILNPRLNLAFSRAQMMAADGRCKVFDARADGYVRSEGCGVVVLKRLCEAQRDGNQILAVLRGTAVNQDGRSNGLTAPNGLAQQAVVQQALNRAGLTPDQISYVEAHGTGTALGDPIEIAALKAVLMTGRSPAHPCWIGSVKANIGHLEAAAGIAGLIKVVLALQQGEIPAQLHLQQLNPLMQLQDTPLQIATERIPWTTLDEQRRAGVSSFGFGGTNAHVIVEAAPVQSVSSPLPDRPLHLLTLSADRPEALYALASRYQQFLTAAPSTNLANICYTANARRSPFRHRLAVVAATVEQTSACLSRYLHGDHRSGVTTGESDSAQPALAFLFTDQVLSSSLLGMGQRLYQTAPQFRQICDQGDAILRLYGQRSLLDWLNPSTPDGHDLETIDRTGNQFIWPVVFVVKYALAMLWQSWGVRPQWVMGQGLGEYIAASVAGVFGLEDGLKLVIEHARLMQSWHSHPGQPIAPAFEQVFEQVAVSLSYAQPHIPLISQFTGQPVTAAIADPAYWVQPIQQSWQQSATGIQTLAAAGCAIFIEMGQSSPLGAAVQDTWADDQSLWLPQPQLQPQDAWSTLLESLAELSVRGVAIDWEGFDQDYPRQRVTLPTYPFQRQRYWLDLENCPARASSRNQTTHSSSTAEPLWRQRLMQVSGRDRLPLLIQLLQQEFARVLGVSSADAVEPRRGFFEMGFDSLMVTELKTRLERALGHPLSATLSFNYPTIVSLATYLLHDVLQLETHEGEVPLATVPDPSAELLHTLENLSEAETEARLLEKLNAL
jgi:acyl transferase domain-containing protein/acyl-CoA synthetase (AMP-forming)/AMP-acid ligase II